MAAGQISAKYGSLQSSEYELPVKTGLNIFHILSYCFLISRAPLWFFILKKSDISTAYPVLSLNYILILFFSVIIFAEDVTPGKLAGSLLITAGVLLVLSGSELQVKKTKKQEV